MVNKLGMISMALEPGAQTKLLSFKHDGSLHRIWEKITFIEENEDWIITANHKTKVIESNGRFWYTKEPSIAVFFKKHWYNVIGIIKPSGISYYCNLSSPILVDQEGIKYIDYDLDIKVMPDFTYNILDKNEYRIHAKRMEYPDSLQEILNREFKHLEQLILNRNIPFEHGFIRQKYTAYKKMGVKKIAEGRKN